MRSGSSNGGSIADYWRHAARVALVSLFLACGSEGLDAGGDGPRSDAGGEAGGERPLSDGRDASGTQAAPDASIDGSADAGSDAGLDSGHDGSGITDSAGTDASAIADSSADANGSTDAGACGLCNTPPDTCHLGPGSCINAVCTYRSVVCNTPPTSTCLNGTTMVASSPLGTCSAGVCSYPTQNVACAASCSNDACTATGWTNQTSNTTSDLRAVWGSSASAVWAVGDGGTAVFYNGSQWKARGPSTNLPLVAVHGTTANNVFAVAEDFTLGNDFGNTWQIFKFNGGTWARVTFAPFNFVRGIYVTGPDEFYATGEVFVTSVQRKYVIARFKNNAWTTLYERMASGFTGWHRTWGVGVTRLWIGDSGITRFDFTPNTFGTGNEAVSDLWVAGADDVYYVTNSSLRHFDGQFDTLVNTGFTGAYYGITGTSPSRLFVAGGSAGPIGVVRSFDGTGWSGEVLPPGTPPLRAIWAAPTSQVFAVGDEGTIIKGP